MVGVSIIKTNSSSIQIDFGDYFNPRYHISDKKLIVPIQKIEKIYQSNQIDANVITMLLTSDASIGRPILAFSNVGDAAIPGMEGSGLSAMQVDSIQGAPISSVDDLLQKLSALLDTESTVLVSSSSHEFGGSETQISFGQVFTTANNLDREWSIYSAGTGNTHSFASGANALQLDLGATALGCTILQSRAAHALDFARGTFIDFTVAQFDTDAATVVKRAGLFSHDSLAAPDPSADNLDGFYLESTDGTVSFVVRRAGVALLNVAQSAWNGDACLGSGDSGYTIDWSKKHKFCIRLVATDEVHLYLALGTTRVRLHSFSHYSTIPETSFMVNGALPLTFSVHSITTPTSAALQILDCSVMHGTGCKQTPIHAHRFAVHKLVPTTYIKADNFSALIGLRLDKAVARNRNHVIKMCSFDVVCQSTNVLYTTFLILNPTLDFTPTWQNVHTNDNVVQYALANEGSRDESVTYDIKKVIHSNVTTGYAASNYFSPIDLQILGAPANLSGAWDELWLCVTPSKSGSFSASMSWCVEK